MTNAELQAIRERAEAAYPGPWLLESNWGVPSDDACEIRSLDDEFRIYGEGGHTHEDAVFIANARTDIPALLDEIAQLRAALAVYADKKNWDVIHSSGGYVCVEWTNGNEDRSPWNIARSALDTPGE